MDDIPSYSTLSFFHSNQSYGITILFTHNSHFRFVDFVRYHARFGDTNEIASVELKTRHFTGQKNGCIWNENFLELKTETLGSMVQV